MNIVTLLLNSKNRLVVGFMVLTILLSLSSCLKDDNSEDSGVPASLVSFIHASPDAGNLIVGVNGYRANSQPFKFGDRIIYQLVYPGGNQFQVNTESDNTKLDVKNWGLEAGVCYSIFAVDRLDSLELLGIRDFYASDVPEDGMARVRFVNLCPDSLQLDLKANTIDTLLASQKKFKQNSAFGNIKADDNTTYTLEIVNHDTGVLVNRVSFTPKQGQYYTVMAAGLIEAEEEAQKLKAFILRHD